MSRTSYTHTHTPMNGRSISTSSGSCSPLFLRDLSRTESDSSYIYLPAVYLLQETETQEKPDLRIKGRMSLEGQWIRICLLLQGTQVRSLALALALGHLSLCASTTRSHALEPCSETSEVAAMRSLCAVAERAERRPTSNNYPAQPKPSKLPLQRS